VGEIEERQRTATARTGVRRIVPAIILAVLVVLAPPASARARRHADRSARLPTRLAVSLVSRVSTSDPVVFLTIDDGWLRDRAVVDVVHRQHIPVTTFLIERAAAKDPAYFRAITSEGGSVEDHTVDHPYLSRLSSRRQTDEVCGPLNWFAATFGSRPVLLRPPYGQYNVTTGEVAKSCGLSAIVLWSVVVDGHNVTTRGGPIRAGDIILLHYRKNLLAGVQTVIDQAHRRGLRFAHLEDYLVAHPPPEPRPTPSEPPPEPPPPSCAPLPVCP